MGINAVELALKVTATGEISRVKLTTPLYRSVQKEIGGYMEIVKPKRLNEPFCMIVDEEGLIKGLPPNQIGSYLHETDKHGHPIVGDILIMKIGITDKGPDIVGLDEKDMKILEETPWLEMLRKSKNNEGGNDCELNSGK